MFNRGFRVAPSTSRYCQDSISSVNFISILTKMTIRLRRKLARKKGKKHYLFGMAVEERNSLAGYEKVCDPARLQSCLVGQAIWLGIMLLQLYIEGCAKNFKFPGFLNLMYIWDDYLPIVYILGISISRHYLTLNHFYLSGAIILGFVPPVINSVWHMLDIYQHAIDFGFSWWEEYPFGVLWWIFLTISRILRCITSYTFLGVLTTWILQPYIYSIRST